MKSTHTHHRNLDRRDNRPENLLELDPYTHDFVHRFTGVAYDHGLLVHSWDDPAEIPCGPIDIVAFLNVVRPWTSVDVDVLIAHYQNPAALEGRTPVGNQEAVQGGEEPMQTTVEGDEVPHSHVVRGPNEKPCPKCKGKGKVVEEPKDETLEQAPPRPKTTWSVRVPKDEREDGHELLTALMDACVERMMALKLIRNANKGAYYYTLLAALRKFATGEDA